MSWSFTLADAQSDTDLLDLTSCALTTKVSPRLSRPLSLTMTVPGDTPGLLDTGYDGRPALDPGRRVVKAYQDGVLRANTLVWLVAPSGDENSSSIEITGIDPLILALTRLVQDDTGAFAAPVFPSPISGAEILEAAINNTVTFDGPLPIDTSGPIASTTDLAADLNDWPITIADLITMLTGSGGLEILLNPVDTHLGFPPGILGQLTAADRLGSDRSAEVHFDYATGLYNVAKIRRTIDMSTLCNKLWYYLGGSTPLDSRHYAGNITGTETGVAPGSEDLTAYQALQLASRDLYGVFMAAKIFDSGADENSQRRLWHRIWKTEVVLRTKPRELVFVTPARGAEAPFRPFIDYTIGDTVAINTSSIVGPAIVDGVQRVYGFDVTIDQDGVETVSELIVSGDGAGGFDPT